MRVNGQTLIETLVALGVGIVVLTAIAITTLVALNNAQFSKDQNLATQYAQEAMEKARSIRETEGWDKFMTYAGSSVGCWCYDGEGGLTKAVGICPINTPPSCPLNTPNVALTPTPTPGTTTPTIPPPLSTNTTLGPYTRSLRFELNSTLDVMTVTGYTVWSTRAGKHEAKLVSTLTKWQTIATLVPIPSASTPPPPICSDQSLVQNPNPPAATKPAGAPYYMTKCEGREPRDNAAALCRAGRSFLCNPNSVSKYISSFSDSYWLANSNSGFCGCSGITCGICPAGCLCNPGQSCSCPTCNRTINGAEGNFGYTTGGGFMYLGFTCPSILYNDANQRYKVAPATDLYGALCCSTTP